MAVVTTTANTYRLGGTQGVGLANREDLLDLITMISPTQTPFFSSVTKGTCGATLHEWLEEELKASTADKGVKEGADFAADTITQPTRVTNFTQIYSNRYQVTKTQEVVTKAGKTSETAWQAMRAMKEHANDIETGLFGNSTGGNSSADTVRLHKPIGDFIHADTTTAGGSAILAEDTMLNLTLEKCWDEGGQPDTAFVTGKVKRRITGFMLDSNRTLNVDGGQGGDKKLTKAVDVYESDFSVIRIIADRFLPVAAGTPDTCSVFLLEMGRWRVDFLRNPHTQDIAPTGDATKHQIISELTVVGLASKSSGEITGVKNDIS